jgi:hypothetical protein
MSDRSVRTVSGSAHTMHSWFNFVLDLIGLALFLALFVLVLVLL